MASVAHETHTTHQPRIFHSGPVMTDIQTAPNGASTWEVAVAVVTLPQLELIEANEGALTFFGLDESDLPRDNETWLSPDDWTLVESRIVPSLTSAVAWSGELRFMSTGNDERAVPVMIVPQLERHAEPFRATMVIASDPSKGAWAGVPDPLTGLPTRAVLVDRLNHALARSERSGNLLASLFVDLDGLKQINDQYGHEVGDTTLTEAARRIRGCLRVEDTVARFGGDEFVILCEALDDEDQARQVADRILASLLDRDADPTIAASIGISFARGGGIDALDLISRADTAMYRAKARGGRRVEVFDREMQNRQDEDDALRHRLLDAISTDNLAVAGQAIFELQTGRIAGVELFIRVRDEARAIISAADVLRLAREHSESIDAAVIGRALSLVRAWQRSLGADAPRLHVNLSAQSMSSDQFVGRITRAVERQHIEPSRIALEIDSNDIVQAADRHLDTIQALQDAGFPIVVDGYGSGPVPLRAVAAINPAMVKITGLERNNASPIPHNVLAALIRAMVGLGISTCVKGIESRSMLNHVVASGSFAGQGNALSAVGTLERVNELLLGRPRLGF